MESRESKPPTRPSSSRVGGIRTLADLNRRSGIDSPSDDEIQEYYAGGEKSGMLVQDNSNRNDADSIFNQARRMGIEQPHDNSYSNRRRFSGIGRLISGDTVPDQQPGDIVHHVILWSNGFVADNGPFRRLDDPTNASFIEAISRSECPKEFEPEDTSSAVHVKIERRQENYTEPEKCATVPFQGVGRTLRSSSSSSDAVEDERNGHCSTAAPAPTVGLFVDETLPWTALQLRLADGTRMVAHFNLHHTITDVRAFINASRPTVSNNYDLQTVDFPPKKLTDPTLTLHQAGLQNSVIIQRLS